MGLFDSVVGALGQAQGGSQAGAQPELLNAVAGLLGNGGLQDLVAKFEQGGLGHLIGSWIGSGQNLPISADQLHQVLGSETIAGLAQQLGLSHGDVAAQLSQLLPQVVDKLTPQGAVPQGGLGEIGSLLGALGR
ncbi:MAG: hypothetical protein ABT20_17980 [Rubrivivax sp. SCN 70-15]|nr:MAG: hypothetical protein ABT20_17980 [Rubrivivax sp. SCN 70-15]